MKRNVRFFSMILALLCVVSMIPVMTVSAETTGVVGNVDLSTYADGSEYTAEDGTTYRVVKSLTQLNSKTTLDGNIILGADIDYTNQKHSAINLNGYIFDGNGYAMYGISATGSGNMGLFSASGAVNVMRNLTIGLPGKEIQMTGTGSGKSSGVLLGYVSGTNTYTFENVTIYVNFTTSKNTVGGFVGNFAGGTLNFTNCKLYGSMTDTAGNPSGGFVGKVSGSATVNISNCANYATVTNTANTGGFVGEMYLSKVTATVNITNSVNVGNITGGNTSGFVGSESGSSDSTTMPIVNINNCLNTGYVEGSRATGFVSWIGQKWYQLTLENSVNMGAIHASGSDGASGLIGRYVNALTIVNCGSFGKITASNTTFGVIATDVGWTPKKIEQLHYTEIANAKDLSKINGYSDSHSIPMTEGLAWTNELLGETFGKLILNTQGTGAVFAAPVFAGVQEHKTAAGNIRLVATLGNSLNYSAVGFDVELVGGNAITVECNSVYQKLLSTDAQGFEEEVTATELYGTYLFALAIENVPTTETVTLKITPYGKDLDGTTVYSGDSYNIVITDGNVVDISACA